MRRPPCHPDTRRGTRRDYVLIELRRSTCQGVWMSDTASSPTVYAGSLLSGGSLDVSPVEPMDRLLGRRNCLSCASLAVKVPRRATILAALCVALLAMFSRRRTRSAASRRTECALLLMLIAARCRGARRVAAAGTIGTGLEGVGGVGCAGVGSIGPVGASGRAADAAETEFRTLAGAAPTCPAVRGRDASSSEADFCTADSAGAGRLATRATSAERLRSRPTVESATSPDADAIPLPDGALSPRAPLDCGPTAAATRESIARSGSDLCSLFASGAGSARRAGDAAGATRV